MPASSVISFVMSLTVRDCRVELIVGPMSAKAVLARHVDTAGCNCAPFVWTIFEQVRVDPCGVGKERLWDKFKVNFVTRSEERRVGKECRL